MSVAKERPHCVKPCMRRAKPGRKTCGDRSCAARAGNRSRVDYREPQPHKCGFKGCTSWVERTAAHKCEADYRRRRFCDEHQHARKGRVGRRKPVRVSGVKRPCPRVGCQREFTSTDKRQVYCGHACAVAARLPGKRPSKVCQCGCGLRFERPNGLNTERWEQRRFLDAAHRAAAPKELRTVQRPKVKAKPAGPHPHALNLPGGAVPGAARAGNRRAPVIRGAKPAKVGGNAQQSVFGDAPPPAPIRFGQVPVVERVVRVAARPSFGLSRRSA